MSLRFFASSLSLHALAGALSLWSAAAASAQAAPGHAYAIVVGSDEGGAGQERLRYAESDAVKVRDALVGVGGYEPSSVTLLRGPRVPDVERALAAVRERVRQHRQRGEATQVVFYYSGHARAQGLHLGHEELRLRDLRAWIDAMGADFALVLLDACQSGAYSRVRGAEPASDFSFNSVSELRTRGIAVMASSSDDELSQESESLRGGFFTHHFVAGLRGAADADGDGRVTLDEVYRYAYTRTLADTSRTAVGGQHVSLETDLHGHGGVLLGYPARADAHLVMPSRLRGSILVQHQRSLAVFAELEKASGASVRLALPTGRYRVLVRSGRSLHECSIALESGAAEAIELGRCEARSPAPDARARGADEGAPRARWGVELAGGIGHVRQDDYVDRLEEFGFEEPFQLFWSPLMRGSLAVERRLPRAMSLVLRAQTFDHAGYQRGGNGPVADAPYEHFDFRTFGVGLGARATGLYRGGRVGLHVELGVGLGVGITRFDSEGSKAEVDGHLGYTLGASGGFRFMPWERFGFLLELGFHHAPILENLIGDVHDSGGGSVSFGIRAETRE